MAHEALKNAGLLDQKIPSEGVVAELPEGAEGLWRLKRLRVLRDLLEKLKTADSPRDSSPPKATDLTLDPFAAFHFGLPVELDRPQLLARMQDTDWSFLLGELNGLIARQQQKLGQKLDRSSELDLELSLVAKVDLARALEAALTAAYGVALARPKPQGRPFVSPDPQNIWRDLINTFPGPLWGYGQEVLNVHYAGWRELMLQQTPGLDLPQTCPISCSMLLRGRFRHWRPHRLLRLYLAEHAKFRGREQLNEANTLPKHFVRLLAARPDHKEALSTGRSRSLSETKEFEQLRQKLAAPRPLQLAGDIDLAIAQLYQRFPWFDEVLTRLRREIMARASQRHGALSFAPFLLVGPPGIGKTRFMRVLAQAFDLPFQRVDRGGETDNRDFAGTARGFGTAEVAMPTRLLSRIEVANPLIFVDEIDKEVPNARHGSATNTLMARLEPETAKDWQDPCLGEVIDLSHINWTLGANSLQPLRGPLLSRLHVHEVSGPRPEHFDALLASIMQDVLERQSGGLGGRSGGQSANGSSHDKGVARTLEGPIAKGADDADGLDLSRRTGLGERFRYLEGKDSGDGGSASNSSRAEAERTAIYSGSNHFGEHKDPPGLHPQIVEALRRQFQRQHLSPRNLARLVDAALGAEIDTRVRRGLM